MGSPTGPPVGLPSAGHQWTRLLQRGPAGSLRVTLFSRPRRPDMPQETLAARAGRWSARHRKIAIAGWLAFVVAAFAIGNAIGTKTLADEDTGNGSSRVADTAIDDANFPKRADETVLIQTRRQLRATDPEFKLAVNDVVDRLHRVPHVTDVKSPYGNSGQR